MDNEKIDMTTHYNLDDTVVALEALTNQKAVKDNIFKTDYMMGNIEEATLLNFGFKFVTISNIVGNKTPIYRLGDIEAVFVDNILHIYKATV